VESVRLGLLCLSGVLAACSASAAGAAETVAIPGAEIAGWGKSPEFPGRFGRAAGAAPKTPAVLILHGSAGVDGRGAFHAAALEEAGIATLEITMFPQGGRPRAGHSATLPYAAAALKWLGSRPEVDARRLGVMGFSWGGVMSVLLSSELVRERLGDDVPKPVASAPLYPVCSGMMRFLQSSKNPLFGAHLRMSATPMLIQVGTRDDYERSERACDEFVALWPAAARERVTVRYFEDATHGFDAQFGSREFFDEFARDGRGGRVKVWASPKDASEARAAVVKFFRASLVAQGER
jgi:uncharacterized protein